MTSSFTWTGHHTLPLRFTSYTTPAGEISIEGIIYCVQVERQVKVLIKKFSYFLSMSQHFCQVCLLVMSLVAIILPPPPRPCTPATLTEDSQSRYFKSGFGKKLGLIWRNRKKTSRTITRLPLLTVLPLFYFMVQAHAFLLLPSLSLILSYLNVAVMVCLFYG